MTQTTSSSLRAALALACLGLAGLATAAGPLTVPCAPVAVAAGSEGPAGIALAPLPAKPLQGLSRLGGRGCTTKRC